MRKRVVGAVVTAALAMCLPAMAGSWSQPVDTMYPIGNLSQEDLDSWHWLSADDWKCTDGQPVNMVTWWGDYSEYEGNNPGPVGPPAALQPTGFVLRQYENDPSNPLDSQPNAMLNEIFMPIADCSQTYVQSVEYPGSGLYIHIFSYQAVLPTAWTQARDSIYWLSVQAQFARAPVAPDDGFEYWEWLNTPPSGSLLGSGHELNFWSSNPWTSVDYLYDLTPYQGQDYNFAFQIGSLPVDLVPNKTTFQTSGDQLSVTADVGVLATRCYPFVRVIPPSGPTLYFQQNVGFVAGVMPFLGMEAGAVTLGTPISDFPILSAPIHNLPKGSYYLEGGAVDAVTTTSINDLKYVGAVDRTELTVE